MLDQININDITNIAKAAGDAIMKIYKKDFHIEFKDDESPLTEADIKSNEIICNALANLYPNIPILSEENKAVSFRDRKKWEYFWLIDPIDGTKEFIKKNGEFTVNIALIHKNTPVLGVVYAPVPNIIYYAKKGIGAFKNTERLPLVKNDTPEKYLNVVASKSHLSKETREFIDRLALTTQELSLVSKGSSLKLCMIAEGTADIYPRLAPTMEWDTAAAHAIVLETGKGVFQYQNDFFSKKRKPASVVYNKPDLHNPWFVVYKYDRYGTSTP